MSRTPPTNPLPSNYCSALSSRTNEQLFGTVSKTDFWLLLEYPFPIGAKALPQSRIPDNVKAHISDSLSQIPDSRLLLIKHEGGFSSNSLRVYLVRSSQTQTALYQLNLATYADLLSVDIQSYGLSHHDIAIAPFPGFLFLVCTNGKRDICCARSGVPVYNAMRHRLEDSVWQSSHVGGHRFAANVICFPEGIYYGRVETNHIDHILDAYQARQVDLSHYRGRSCYPRPAQAAEYFLRKETGNLDIDAFHLVDIQETGAESWNVQFVLRGSNTLYSLSITSRQADFELFESCAKPNKKVAPTQYSLTSYQLSI